MNKKSDQTVNLNSIKSTSFAYLVFFLVVVVVVVVVVVGCGVVLEFCIINQI